MSGTQITISPEARLMLQTDLELNLTLAEAELSRNLLEEANAMAMSREAAEKARIARNNVGKFQVIVDRLKLRIKGISEGFSLEDV